MARGRVIGLATFGDLAELLGPKVVVAYQVGVTRIALPFKDEADPPSC